MLEVRYQSIQTALSTINVEHKEENMKDFKLKLEDLYNSMSNLFRLQHTKITKLESDMENLRKQMKLQEKSKLIGDLLIPLASEIHQYLETLDGKPHSYDDVSIYTAFQEKSIGNNKLEDEYKRFYEKTIDDETYAKFYEFLYQKSAHLNMNIYIFLSLLRAKKIRNFTQHSDLQDFFLDSLKNYQYQFSDLINKHQLKDVLDDDHYNALKAIFDTYFHRQINQARQLEQQGKRKRP